MSQPDMSQTDMSQPITDDELYAALKEHPLFEYLPLPKSWYEKYGLKLKPPMNFREAIEANRAIKAMFEPDDLPSETIPTPKDYVFAEMKPLEVPLEIISKEVK
jgi:hypothetical protein